MADNAVAYPKDEKGRFVTGNIGGGRPKGARNKLGEAFIQALQEDFDEHGVAAIQAARVESPIQYVKVIASLLPSEHKVTFAEQYDGMTDAELADRARQLAAAIAPLLAGGTGEANQGPQGEGSPQQPAGLH